MNFRKLLDIISVFTFVAILAQGVHVRAQSQLRILPLGNSITRGSMCLNGSVSGCDHLSDAEAIGYRHRLYNLMVNAGYNVDFVGNYKYGYQIMSDPDNAGFDGIRDNALADVMETGTSSYTGQVTPGPYLNYFPADVVLLHIGTNDVLADDYFTVSDVASILDAIDDYETAHSQPILVFLARIISRRNRSCNTDYGITQYNSRLVSMAQSRINNGDLIVLVDMECGAGLNYYSDLIDEVHPNQTGYDKMGDKWFDVIDGYNSAPVVSQIPDQTRDRGSSFAQITLDNYVTDVEDDPQDMTWSVSPSSPEHFQITIDANRKATISPIDPHWSGSETIDFIAMDMGRVITGLQKVDFCSVDFTVNWMPEIIGQQDLTIPGGNPYEITLDDLLIVEPEKAPPGIEVIVEGGDNYTVDGSTITPVQGFTGYLIVPVSIEVAGKESDTYELNVEVIQVNFPPVITSSPVQSVNTNEEYVYEMIAEDPDPYDILIYSATEKPGWMQVNSETGLVSGTPAKDDTGIYQVTLAVSDGQNIVEQSFPLEVTYLNHPPDFLSEPAETATISQTYTYGVQASDREGDPVSYFASILPGWLEFYPQSKVLIGIPGYEDYGTHMVVLGASDEADTSYQVYHLFVDFPAGGKDLVTGDQFMLYPNPSPGYIILDISDMFRPTAGVIFELYDLTGHKVYQMKIDRPQTEIRFRDEGISSGIYLFRLRAGNTRGSGRSGRLIIY